MEGHGRVGEGQGEHGRVGEGHGEQGRVEGEIWEPDAEPMPDISVRLPSPVWPPAPTEVTAGYFAFIKKHLKRCIDDQTYEEYVDTCGLLTYTNIYGDKIWRAMRKTFESTYRYNYQFTGCAMLSGWFWLPEQFARDKALTPLTHDEGKVWPYPCLYFQKTSTEVWVCCLYILRQNNKAWSAHESRVKEVQVSESV